MITSTTSVATKVFENWNWNWKFSSTSYKIMWSYTVNAWMIFNIYYFSFIFVNIFMSYSLLIKEIADLVWLILVLTQKIKHHIGVSPMPLPIDDAILSHMISMVRCATIWYTHNIHLTVFFKNIFKILNMWNRIRWNNCRCTLFLYSDLHHNQQRHFRRPLC